MQKRVKKEAEDFEYYPLPNMHIMSPCYLEDKFIKQMWLLVGPNQSPYSQKTFLVQVMSTGDYPFRPPKIRFITQIFHPSICPSGQLGCCVFPQYRDHWSPALNIAILLSKVIEMMQFPKMYLRNKCGNFEAINLITQDEASFYLRAKQQANKHGIDALLDY